MKSVALVITRMIPGGASKVVRQIIEGGIGEYDFTLFTGQEDLDNKIISELPSVCKVVYIPALIRNISPLKDYAAYLHLSRELRRGKFDVVHTHTSKAGFIGRLAAVKAGIPVIIHSPHGTIYTTDSIDGVPTFSFGKKMLQLAEKFAGHKTTYLTTLSEHEKRVCIDLGLAKAENTVVIPNGIDCRDFSVSNDDRINARKSLSLNEDDLVILSIGRLSKEKGHTVLLDAFSMVSKALGSRHEALGGRAVGDQKMEDGGREEDRGRRTVEEKKTEDRGREYPISNKEHSTDEVGQRIEGGRRKTEEVEYPISNEKEQFLNHQITKSPNLKLIIVGDGPEMDALRKQTEALGLRHEALGGREDGGQRTEDGGRRAEVGERKSEDGGRRTEEEVREEIKENTDRKNIESVIDDQLSATGRQEYLADEQKLKSPNHRITKSSILFAGHQDKIKPYLAAADIFVLPSFYEGFGIALIEAMAAGLPAIASDVGGVPEIITDGRNGLLFASGTGNALELVEKIQLLIDSQEKREALGKAGKIRAGDFSTERMLAAYFQLYG